MLGVLVSAFFAVVFGIPSCRWLLLGDCRPTAREESFCRMFGQFSRDTAILMALSYLIQLFIAGKTVPVVMAVLMMLLLAVYTYRFLRKL